MSSLCLTLTLVSTFQTRRHYYNDSMKLVIDMWEWERLPLEVFEKLLIQSVSVFIIPFSVSNLLFGVVLSK